MTNSTVANQLSKLNADKSVEAAPTKVAPKQMFQQYKCPRQSMRAVTTTGVQIKFVNYELLTQDPEVIEYLDSEIKRNGLSGVTKGEELSLDDRNPEKAMERRLREKIEKEMEEKIKAGTFGQIRQLGETAGAPTLSPSSSKSVAN